MRFPVIEVHYAYRAADPEAMEGVFLVGNRDHLSVQAAEQALWEALDWNGTFVADQLGVPELAPWAYVPATWNERFDASRHTFLRLRGVSASEALQSGAMQLTHDIQDLIEAAKCAQRAGWQDFVIDNGTRRYGLRGTPRLALAG